MTYDFLPKVNDVHPILTEHLRSAEDTLEANEHIVDKAMKTVRGMTWAGMFYNMISADRQTNVSHRDDITTVRKATTTTTSTTNSAPSSSSVQSHNKEQLSSSSSAAADDKKELDMLLTSVTQLHDISLSLGQKIEQQYATLERMEEKATRVNDQTLAVTLKASQLTQRSSGDIPVHFHPRHIPSRSIIFPMHSMITCTALPSCSITNR